MTPTYPGVYVEELPSGVHTISGVATSIAAFIGWAPKGTTRASELCLSWLDYQRKCGGLNPDSLMSYAVNQFFANGGTQAYIIRIVGSGAQAASADFGSLKILANSEGKWGQGYAIRITLRTDDTTNTHFRVAVLKIDPTDPSNANNTAAEVESFENLSMTVSDPRYALSVLNNRSSYIIAQAGSGTGVPTTTTFTALNSAANDGTVIGPGDSDFQTGVEDARARLDRIDLFNLLCVPGLTDGPTVQTMAQYCKDRRAFMIVDCAEDSQTTDNATNDLQPMLGVAGDHAAFYFPWINAPDPLQQNRPSAYPPCGFVAGLYATTDAERGVWKAPAGVDAALTGIQGLTIDLTNDENGVLNQLAVNCLRTFNLYGTVIWGARTMFGQNDRGSDWKYVPVRRTALFLEESLYRGLKWVVFEPNDEPLWAQIRLNVGAFMHSLFRLGAFQGKTPREAYFVKCDSETTTQNDIDQGMVNILVGFAPLKPAEFVMLQIQQIAGQLQT
jgi:phage tail sheath protein FI